MAYKTAIIQKIPFYYFADELLEHLLKGNVGSKRNVMIRENFIANKKAIASIALGKDRYSVQKQQNKIDYPHEYFIFA